MTDVQKILSALAEAIHDGQVGEEDCTALLKALRGVPAEYHMAALMSMLGADQQGQEEKPDDYAVVRTFNSIDFNIGDEIKDNFGHACVICGRPHAGLTPVFGSSPIAAIDLEKADYHRTGRNFPAIAAILEEIGK